MIKLNIRHTILCVVFQLCIRRLGAESSASDS